MTTQPVVVGVNDSADARSAVLWAVREAALARTSLLVVHSPGLPPATVPAARLHAALRAADDIGRSVLDAAIAVARAHEPEVMVRGLLSHADPAQALIDLSAEAQLLVLGSRTAAMGDLSMLASRRVTVSAHAHCPVLLLGPVSSFSPAEEVCRIVVGAATTRAGRAAVAFAAAEAARRNVALHLLRLAGAEGAATTDSSQGQDALAAQVARIRRECPGLAVVADVVAGEASEILPTYSDNRSILVVGCHHSEDHWSTRLGPVATSVIHRNRGAVVVVGYVHDFQADFQFHPDPVLSSSY
jgi:Universal stress protein family